MGGASTAATTRAESAIWLAIHVTGGSANAVLSRPPYAPPKVSSAGWVGADGYSL
jgi:hypothetical protein